LYNVVLIDDEKFILSSLEARVDWTGLGFRIVGRETSAADGYEIICRLKPDVVFTDVKMPGMNGIELMKKVSVIFPQIKFVVISGYAQFEYVKAAMECGAEGYCVKPFDEDEIGALLTKIKRNLDGVYDKSMEDDGTFFTYLSQNISAARQKCRDLLLRSSIDEIHSKVICLMTHGKQFDFGRSYKHLFFETGSLDGYVMETNIPGSIFSSYEEGFSAGISTLFSEADDLNRVYDEAKLAYYQRFISGKNVNIYESHGNKKACDGLLSDFEIALVSGDFLGINQIFSAFYEIFQKGEGNIENCSHIHTVIMRLCGKEPPTTSEEICDMLLHDYTDVNDMLEHLKKTVEMMLLGDLPEKEPNEAMRKIVSYILANYYLTDLTLQSLAKVFQFNPNYLSQLFTKHKKQKFTAYLTDVRMQHAQILLERSDATIGSIAEKVGYMEYFYFAKVFKKHFGVTPSEYRISISR